MVLVHVKHAGSNVGRATLLSRCIAAMRALLLLDAKGPPSAVIMPPTLVHMLPASAATAAAAAVAASMTITAAALGHT